MADKGDFQSVVDNDEFVTIPSGTTTSTHFDCKGMIVKGINIPSAFTSASLRLQSSPTIDGVYNDLFSYNYGNFGFHEGYCRIDEIRDMTDEEKEHVSQNNWWSLPQQFYQSMPGGTSLGGN